MKLTFYGGAGQVTGANYLLDSGSGGARLATPSNKATGSKKILIDCGLNQGTKFAEDLNYSDFGYSPSEIDAVIITHSHMDHVGRLPKLFKDGFRGKIYATEPTVDLAAAALPNSWSLIKDEAKRDNHAPLYDKKDVDGIFTLTEKLDYHQEVDLGDNIYLMLHDAGHILGSSIVEIGWGEGKKIKRIYFSGDLGNPPTPFLKPTEYIRNADYLVVESAYGDRIHEDRTLRKTELEDIIEETVAANGTLMIPSFAIERTQELLFELNSLVENKRIPPVPVFVDSPLAIKITEVYKRYPDYFNKEATYLLESGDAIFKFPGLKLTKTTEQSKAINEVPPPKIIIAGSGMSVGGRILHHERKYLPDPNSMILFIGYQVGGSLGRRILEIGQAKKKDPSAKNTVRIFGSTVPVNSRVKAIGGYSAHADQPALLRWVKAARSYLEGSESCSWHNNSQPANDSEPWHPNKKLGGGVQAATSGPEHKLKKVFVVQGEKDASETLAKVIKEDLSINATVPERGQSYEL